MTGLVIASAMILNVGSANADDGRGVFEILSVNTGSGCLTEDAGSWNAVVANGCTEGQASSSQQWRPVPASASNVQLVNVASGMCLSWAWVQDNPDQRIFTEPCNGSRQQEWYYGDWDAAEGGFQIVIANGLLPDYRLYVVRYAQLDLAPPTRPGMIWRMHRRA